MERIHVRNSERGTLDRCPQQWWWAWREGLRPKETAKPLWFGTGIHIALAHYYGPGNKRRKDFIDVWRAYADEEAEYMRVQIGGIDEDMFIEARELGESMLTEYVKEYDHDRDWDVIATEQTFSVTVPFVFPSEDEDIWRAWLKEAGYHDDYFILDGTFDGVYRDKRDKRTKLMEHKTAGSISIGHLPMDNQAGTYWMVAQTVGRSQGWLGKRENIHEITYNFLRKALPDTRPRDAQGYCTNKPLKEHYVKALADNGIELLKIPTLAVLEQMAEKAGIIVLGERSKQQPPPLFERHSVKRTPRERKTQLHRLQAEVNKMLLYRMGILELTKAPRRDTCSFCAFREMSELHERNSDWVEFRDAMYRQSDPYADHRKSAAVT